MPDESLVRNITVNIKTEGDVRAIAALARLEQAQAAVLRATNSAANATKAMGTVMKGANDNTGRFNAGVQNLGYQLQDFTVQVAGGTSAIRAFGQQMPQAVGALASMAKEGSLLATIFTGIPGLIIGVGAALVPLITQLFDTADAADKAADALSKMSRVELTKHLVEQQKDLNDAISTTNTLGGAAANSLKAWAGAFTLGQTGDPKKAKALAEQNEDAIRRSIKFTELQISVLDKAAQSSDKAATATTRRTAATVANTKAVGDNAAALEDQVQEFLKTMAAQGQSQAGMSIDDKLNSWQANNAPTDEQIAKWTQLSNTVEDYTNGAFKNFEDQQNAFWSDEGAGGKAAVDIINNIGDAFSDAASGAKTFGDAFEDMGKIVVKILVDLAAKWLIIQALQAIFPGSKMVGNITKKLGFANGGVFENGHQVTAYAKGGIVTTPTLFPMANGAGLMGEAGPEAVMPLQRTSDGKLGVSAAPMQVNVYNNTNSQVSVNQDGDNISIIIEQARKAVAADIARGDGSVSAAIQSTYKLGRGK